MPKRLALRHKRRYAHGLQVAIALEAAWRDSPPPSSTSAPVLAEIVPLLVRGGAGPLVWRRLRQSALGSSPSAQPLREAYRFHTLRDAVSEEDIKRLVRRIRAAGVEPILAKGWAMARLYPEPGVRPYGDVDLYVPAEHYPVALSSLRTWDEPPGAVDLHHGFRDLEDRSIDEVYRRSILIDREGTKVRVLGPEDHLRLICLHLLRHGAARPLWLCDVGAAIESRPRDFDWDYLFAGDPMRSRYVASTLLLAHRLLGARIEDTPLGNASQGLPSWVVPAVLRAWGAGFKRREPIRGVGRLFDLVEELGRHWPNPIEATARTGAPWNALPRLPFQVVNSVTRTARFVHNRTRGRSSAEPSQGKSKSTAARLPRTQ